MKVKKFHGDDVARTLFLLKELNDVPKESIHKYWRENFLMDVADIDLWDACGDRVSRSMYGRIRRDDFFSECLFEYRNWAEQNRRSTLSIPIEANGIKSDLDGEYWNVFGK